ncbi:MAG: hybrid sensor histidine kinase/response regulator, partial [Pseudomonas stutzeri]|nr:hybrid sensor histidine kinase/response regulator [Stutzerimonas stutzeri]NIS57883.1 hybrid sensor histidine kinase/response regulator [Stutzerimonas stutzeri]
YTLLLPTFADAGWLSSDFVENGLFGVAALAPRALLGVPLEPLTHGVLWSLAVNVAVYVGASLLAQPTPVERLQATAFVSPELTAAQPPSFRLWRTSVTIAELEATVARYLGTERTRRSFDEFAQARDLTLMPGVEADVRMLRYAEHLLASAVGAASARLVLALMLERNSANTRGAMKLLDDASAAIQYNRDLLQSAIDQVRQGIAVFDSNMNLICWNR